MKWQHTISKSIAPGYIKNKYSIIKFRADEKVSEYGGRYEAEMGRSFDLMKRLSNASKASECVVIMKEGHILAVECGVSWL